MVPHMFCRLEAVASVSTVVPFPSVLSPALAHATHQEELFPAPAAERWKMSDPAEPGAFTATHEEARSSSFVALKPVPLPVRVLPSP
jgi:hypothetical protein